MNTLSVWPLVAAASSAVLIGYIWYHPRVFGAHWMRLSGITPEMAERGASRMRLYAALGFVACLVAAGVTRTVIDALLVIDIPSAIRAGAFLWLGFVAPALLGSVLWEHRSFSLYLINAGYWLVALVAMAVVLVL